jgi:hypothetical protein
MTFELGIAEAAHDDITRNAAIQGHPYSCCLLFIKRVSLDPFDNFTVGESSCHD